jgi:hypothetical protein
MRKIVFGTAVAAMAVASSAQAAVLVEFGPDGSGTESGATNVSGTSGTVNGTTVTVASIGAATNIVTRSRGVLADLGTFTQNELFDDFIRADVGTVGAGLRVTLNGGEIVAGQQYQVTAFAFDPQGTGSGNTSAVNTQAFAVNGVPAGSVTYTGTNSTAQQSLASNGLFSVTTLVTATNLGIILDTTFVSSVGAPNVGGYQSVVLNGVQVTAVPEPTTIGLLSLGGLAALRRRRA